MTIDSPTTSLPPSFQSGDPPGCWKPLILFLVITSLTSGIVAAITAISSKTWYVTLIKPAYITPPNYVFGMVWYTLYVMYAVVGWMLWKDYVEGKISHCMALLSLGLWVLQLLLQILWNVLFFGLNRLDLAFFEIIGLWCVMLVGLIVTRRCSKQAATLLVPYGLWLTYVAFLVGSFWQIN